MKKSTAFKFWPLILSSILFVAVAPFASALTSGEDVTGTITIADPFDSYTIQCPANGVIRAGLGYVSGDIQPYVEIIDPSGTRIAFRSTTLLTGAAAYANTTTAGTYTVIVSDNGNDDAGTYRLSVVTAPAAIHNGDDNRHLASGQDIEGSLPLGDFDIFTIQCPANGVIRAGLGNASGDIQPYVEIIDPSGTRIAFRSTTLLTGAAAYANTTTAGTYTVIVSDNGNDDAGTYRLSVVTSPSECIAASSNSILNSGQTRTANLELGDFDVHTFGGISGDEIQMDLISNTSGFTPQFQLISPTGSIVYGTSGPVSTALTLNSTGTYTVIMSESGNNNAGSYSLTISGFTGNANTKFITTPERIPELTVVRMPDGSLDFEWPLAITGWELKASPTLATGSFTPVATSQDSVRNYLRVISPTGKMFYRLERIAPSGSD